MKEKELANFCKQLVKIVRAGMTFEEGMRLLADEEENNAIINTKEKMDGGKTFLEALKEEQLFHEGFIEMVEVGFETGHLDVVFRELAIYYEREEWLKNTLKSVLYYPAILGSMLIVVMSILLMKVMPIFEEVFMGMGVIPTGLTKWLFEISQIMGVGILGIMIFFWLGVGMLYGLACYKHTKKLCQRLYNKSKVVELMNYIRFTRMLGLMLKSGIDLHRTFELGYLLLTEGELRDKVKSCNTELLKVFDLEKALKESKLFPVFMRKNIVLGLMAGNLDEAFEESAKDFEERLEKILTRRLSIIEPTIVGTISLIVGCILLVVMMPLMSMMNGLFV